MTDYYAGKTQKSFDHIVVDVAQDLGIPELRFLAAIAPAGADALFFAGDQTLGVNVAGRSTTLKVNYRASHQIRETADRLLPGAFADVDGATKNAKARCQYSTDPRR